jgi:hypothetical protein
LFLFFVVLGFFFFLIGKPFTTWAMLLALCFSDRVLCSLPGLALYSDPQTSASHIAKIAGVMHLTCLILWDRVPLSISCAVLKHPSSILYRPSSWDYMCEAMCLLPFLFFEFKEKKLLKIQKTIPKRLTFPENCSYSMHC